MIFLWLFLGGEGIGITHFGENLSAEDFGMFVSVMLCFPEIVEFFRVRYGVAVLLTNLEVCVPAEEDGAVQDLESIPETPAAVSDPRLVTDTGLCQISRQLVTDKS